MNQNRIEVGDEEVEQHKHYDEEAAVSSSRTGDNSRHAVASTSAPEKDKNSSNKDMARETQDKNS